jgi:hypothetical protein
VQQHAACEAIVGLFDTQVDVGPALPSTFGCSTLVDRTCASTCLHATAADYER